MTTNTNVLVTQLGRKVYVHLYKDPETTGVLLADFAALPTKATLLNTGQELEVRLDRRGAALWFQTPYLRIRGLPVNELLDEVLVVKLAFEGGRV
jgi:alpha-L-fucosidase